MKLPQTIPALFQLVFNIKRKQIMNRAVLPTLEKKAPELAGVC